MCQGVLDNREEFYGIGSLPLPLGDLGFKLKSLVSWFKQNLTQPTHLTLNMI